MLLLLQVLYTLTGWKWVKTVLGALFVLKIVLTVFGIGFMISVLPQLMDLIEQLIMSL